MTLTASTGRGTSSSVTSSARVLPDAGSGDRKAMRGVDSQASMQVRVGDPQRMRDAGVS